MNDKKRQKEIKKYRKWLLKQLKKQKTDDVRKIDLPKEEQKDILFDYNERNDKYYLTDFFPRALLEKIDFADISFDKVEVSCINFKNLKNVKINPQTVHKKDLSFSKLAGVEFIGPFDNTCISYTSFKGSKNAKINPQVIKDASMRHSVFSDVEFIGSLDGVDFSGSDFKNSKNAVINPALTDIGQCNCEDVRFINSLGFRTFYSGIYHDGSNYKEIEDIEQKLRDYIKNNGKPELFITEEDYIPLYRRVLKGELYKINQTIKSPFPPHILQKVIFDQEEDHYVINKELNQHWTKIDFTDVSFDNVLVRWLDFSNATGVKINPQTVYQKDLSHTICNGVEFITDEKKTNMVDIFKDVKLFCTDFRGSSNVYINPQTIKDKSLTGTICYGVDFLNYPFDGVNVENADFNQSKNVNLDPQTIAGKSLSGTKCSDIDFTDKSFDDVLVENANFLGSAGVKINPQTIREKTLNNTACFGVEFTGSFENVSIDGTDFRWSNYHAIVNNNGSENKNKVLMKIF